MSHSISARANAELLDSKYADWKDDPTSVDSSWASFFEGFEIGMTQTPKTKSGEGGSGASEMVGGLDIATRARLVSLVYNYRTMGHIKAWVDPLEKAPPHQEMFELESLGFTEADLDERVSTQFYEGGRTMPLRELIERLEKIYCGRVGYEYMHIHKQEVRNWLRERIENRIDQEPPSKEEQKDVLTWLTHAEMFERFLHRKYVGQKRFSLEGGDSLMVALNGILKGCPGNGIKEITLGMAHRGRLNVLANLLGKPLSVLFYEFSDNYIPNMVAGDGDVKYHLGFEATRSVPDGDVEIHLGANPSHLEAVNGVVEGKARSRQRDFDKLKRDLGVERQPVLPILVHGDAAFAGQGSVAEVLNLSQLSGYRTGGTVHLVVNNQIGFTTTPADARSSTYCTDVAKMIEAPIFHVNGDSPMDVLFVSQLALAFRQKFKRDVVIDIVCYRRHGHNEGDEPAFTLPKTYREIRSHKTTLQLFRAALDQSGDIPKDESDKVEEVYQSQLDSEMAELEKAQEKGLGHQLRTELPMPQPPYSHETVRTGVAVANLRRIGKKISTIPDGVNINSKLAQRFLGAREKAIDSGEGINWAFAEALAFGSMLKEDTAVRLSGQDCRRGTFSQRHAVLYDPENRERYTALNHLDKNQKQKLWVYNSHLSEFAVLAFEYGYSLSTEDMLVLWEAQFGDFANGAQVIIDQFISSAESKWQRNSNLVMLLPHGYEGQGPEHSSARLERFLQLCAAQNMIIGNLTTPAQYFHVLRRQVVREVKKPLILMTPKSLLTLPECTSTLKEMGKGTAFQEMIDDSTPEREKNPEKINRLIFCSGKVYYDLLRHRNADESLSKTAIIRIEQLYPYHKDRLKEIVDGYPKASKWVWCQEEPLNMGAWSFIGPRIQKLTKHKVRYAGRSSAASPAGGSKKVHTLEQKRLIENAFEV